ncbi:MAG TPA: nucleotidyltransferase domain-containing protein [Candidatus Limnocylindria bacterium]|nr:nucleotidyltransferase domain-containing protein [Candidatus Limnocylindria bacterium]
MRIDQALDDVFETGGHVRILRAATGLPRGFSASARDLARRAGVAHTTAARVLRSLAAHRIVDVQRAGRADLYRLNEQHELVPKIRALFLGESEIRQALFDHLADQLIRRAGPIKAAYVFGSVSRGRAGPESDVDLAIVGAHRTEDQLEPVLASLSDEVRERFGIELNVIVDRPSKKRAPIWRTIERDGIRILPRRGAGA